MNCKMQQIINIGSLFAKTDLTHKSLPIKTTYKFTKLIQAVDKELEFYKAQINSIVQNHAQLNADGTIVKTTDGNGIVFKEGEQAAASKELAELSGLDIELPDIEFTVDELDGLELTIEEFTYLMPFIKD